MAVRWSRRGYTPEQFKEAWLSSRNIREVGRKLGCNADGGGYYTIRSAAQDLGLTEDHMASPAGGRQAQIIRMPLSDILVADSTYQNTSCLRRRLVDEGLLEERCATCGITEWNGRAAPLCLDHVNGDRRDNRLGNLRILCHNCHAQTETFGSKNVARKV